MDHPVYYYIFRFFSFSLETVKRIEKYDNIQCGPFKIAKLKVRMYLESENILDLKYSDTKP